MTEEEIEKERDHLTKEYIPIKNPLSMSHVERDVYLLSCKHFLVVGFDAAVKLIREREVGPLKKQVFVLNELTTGLMEKDINRE